MTAERRENFLALSVELTAFSEIELIGTGLSERYLDTVDQIVGRDTVDTLLAAHVALGDGATRAVPGGRIGDGNVAGIESRPGRHQQLRRTILGDPFLGPLARNIIKLWYVGMWYQLPRSWREAHGALDGDITFTVSPEAYVQGLLWPAIGANPSGAKAPGWASWSSPPSIAVS